MQAFLVLYGSCGTWYAGRKLCNNFNIMTWDISRIAIHTKSRQNLHPEPFGAMPTPSTVLTHWTARENSRLVCIIVGKIENVHKTTSILQCDSTEVRKTPYQIIEWTYILCVNRNFRYRRSQHARLFRLLWRGAEKRDKDSWMSQWSGKSIFPLWYGHEANFTRPNA